MRRAARVDDNQKEIVAALRKEGATVECLHAVGKGCPDLLVGFNGVNILMEVKDGKKSISQRKLTDDQVKWHDEWKGQKIVAKSVAEALYIIHEKYNSSTISSDDKPVRCLPRDN